MVRSVVDPNEKEKERIMTIEKIAGEAKTTTGAAYSRRNFLKGVTAAGALAAFGLAGCAPKTTSEMAAKAGAAVRVIEKHKMAGGNSVYADGQIAVVGSAAQKAAGIEDSIETFMNDALTAGLNLNYKDKLQLMGEKSNEVFEWTVSEIGVEWAQDEATGAPQLIAQGGHTVTRCIPPLVNSGSGIVKPLIEKLSGLGVEVETGKQLVGLVRDETGRVVGATVAEGCSDYDPATASSTTNVKTTRGVVLATGGYGKDVTFRSAQDPRLDETVGCTNFEGATAHGLRVALDAGVMGMQLDQIQCYPYTSPKEDSFGCAATWIEAESAYAPTIDPTTGKRFVNELIDRKRFCDAMFEVGTPLVQIGSVDNVPDWCAESLENALSAGEAIGGVHGACRLGCNGTLDCLVNGRIAGQQVAALEPVA